MTPGKDETIFPSTRGISLIVGEAVLRNDMHAVWSARAFSRVNVIFILTKFRTKPRITSCWDGLKTDFSGWVTSPKISIYIMTLNLKKTWEMILKSSSQKVPPAPLAIVERKTKLKLLLGITFEDDPVNWDSHIDHMLSRASSRLYILRVCRFYGYPKEQ